MLEKLWESIDKYENTTIVPEILAWTYFNPPSNKLKDIMTEFDKWDISMLESIIEEVTLMPTIEGESSPETQFGVKEYTCDLLYNEGCNLAVLPQTVWNLSRNSKRYFF